MAPAMSNSHSLSESDLPDQIRWQVDAAANRIRSLLVEESGARRSPIATTTPNSCACPVSEGRAVARIGVILGSGLGGFADALRIDRRIPYSELPGWPVSTALGHAGRLVCGHLGTVPLLVLQGRCHLYEGYTFDDVTFPVRVLHRLGVETLVVSCAAGGLDPRLAVGELMLIDDHIDLLIERRSSNALARTASPGRSDANPDASSVGCGMGNVSPSSGSPKGVGIGLSPVLSASPAPYDRKFAARLLEIAGRRNVPLSRGTYVAVTGPNYETRAELRFLRQIAHAVGMSTVPEATVAHSLGMRVCGLATITNLCRPDRHAEAPVDAEHVLQAAAQAEPRFRALLREFLVAQHF